MATLGLALALTAPAAAQENEPVIIGTAITLHSEILDEDRRLLIYLPHGYDRSAQRYPVLYLLDGPAHFHHVTGSVGFLARADRIPAMIVVGIANTDRDRDLKPAARVTRLTEELPHFDATVSMDYPSAGGADQFLQFLTEELMPHIEARYRTAPFRMLVGHSSGGLFALHALLSRPAAFNAVVASSPVLWWDEGALVKRATAGPLPDFGTQPRFLYMATGDEGALMIGPLSDLATAFELAQPENLRWWYRLNPGESHVSMPHRTIYDALETIFSEYAVSETVIMSGNLARVERQMARASEIYGYEIRPAEALVSGMGYMQLRLFDRPAKAVEIFRRNTELYPESPGARDALVDALEALRERAGAEAAFDSTDALVARGDSFVQSGRFDRAIALYEKAAALQPDSDVADGRLYRSYLALGMFERAAAWQRRARERGGQAPYPGWWNCRLALTAIFRGDREALALQADSLLALTPGHDAGAWECAAFNEVYLRRYADAKSHLELHITQAMPDETPLNLGFVHLQLGEEEAGERILSEGEARARRAATDDPDSWEPWFELAEIASMRGEVEAAIRDMTTAIDRGMDREWWVFHLFSPDALPDPVFEPLYDHPAFERLRVRMMTKRHRMREYLQAHEQAASQAVETRHYSHVRQGAAS